MPSVIPDWRRLWLPPSSPDRSTAIAGVFGTGAVGTVLAGITGTAGVWTDVTPAGISLATDVTGAPNWTGHMGTDAFGCIGIAADPYHPWVAYCGADCQGLWKTTDYGLTWFQVNDGKQSPALDGTLWSTSVAPTYILAVDGYSSDEGVLRSTDGGVTWTKVYSGDTACVSVCKADPTRCMVTAHGPTSPIPDWAWSQDSGLTWTAIPDQGQGIAHNGTWLDANTFISQGPTGVWQGKVSGTTWTFAKVIDTESNHGGTQMFLDTPNGKFYVGVALPGPGRQQILVTTLASRGDSWTVVSDILGGGGWGSSTVFGTTANIYSQGNYATHGTNGPLAEHAALPAGTSWSTDTLPAGIENGAHSAAVLTDGVRFCILTAHDNDGIWRYVE